MDDYPPLPRGALVVAADRRALRGALSNFDASDMPEALATALVQRFGRNRAELILARAMERME